MSPRIIEEPTVLVLAPASMPLSTPGSIQFKAGCDHQVWCSVNAQDLLLDKPETETLCLTCFQERDEPEATEIGTMASAALVVSETLGIPLDQVDRHIDRAIDTLKAPRAARPE